MNCLSTQRIYMCQKNRAIFLGKCISFCSGKGENSILPLKIFSKQPGLSSLFWHCQSFRFCPFISVKIDMGNTALHKTETQNGKRMSSVANVVCEALEGERGGERGINRTADVLPSSIVGLVLRNFYLNDYKMKFQHIGLQKFRQLFH